MACLVKDAAALVLSQSRCDVQTGRTYASGCYTEREAGFGHGLYQSLVSLDHGLATAFKVGSGCAA